MAGTGSYMRCGTQAGMCTTQYVLHLPVCVQNNEFKHNICTKSGKARPMMENESGVKSVHTSYYSTTKSIKSDNILVYYRPFLKNMNYFANQCDYR